MWLPRHTGIAGNEKADDLARRGARTNKLQPRPHLRYILRQNRAEMNGSTGKIHANYFCQATQRKSHGNSKLKTT